MLLNLEHNQWAVERPAATRRTAQAIHMVLTGSLLASVNKMETNYNQIQGKSNETQLFNLSECFCRNTVLTLQAWYSFHYPINAMGKSPEATSSHT